MLVLESADGAQVLVPVLVLQMFAASTGFAVPARRGHYDLLLTGGSGRLQVLAIHLIVSIAPGAAAWFTVAGVELALSGSSVGLTSGSVAALLIVSALAWALTLPLPPLSGGLMWLLAIVILVATSEHWQEVIVDRSAPASVASGGFVYALCPFLLIGKRFSLLDAHLLLPALVLATAAVTLGLAWMWQLDVTLEAPQ
jgi:hypothetical protein